MNNESSFSSAPPLPVLGLDRAAGPAQDPDRTFDRRVAVALAIVRDNAESR
jgi:hypothetical protein